MDFSHIHDIAINDQAIITADNIHFFIRRRLRDYLKHAANTFYTSCQYIYFFFCIV